MNVILGNHIVMSSDVDASGEDMDGFVGLTPSTLLLVWTPLYWLSSLLGERQTID